MIPITKALHNNDVWRHNKKMHPAGEDPTPTPEPTESSTIFINFAAYQNEQDSEGMGNGNVKYETISEDEYTITLHNRDDAEMFHTIQTAFSNSMSSGKIVVFKINTCGRFDDNGTALFSIGVIQSTPEQSSVDYTASVFCRMPNNSSDSACFYTIVVGHPYDMDDDIIEIRYKIKRWN